jgi:hypothetical protein
MTVAETIGIISVLLAALSAVVGVAWRASSALVAVRLELAEIRVELRAILAGPPQWCHRARSECRADYEPREPTGVRASPVRMPGGS